MTREAKPTPDLRAGEFCTPERPDPKALLHVGAQSDPEGRWSCRDCGISWSSREQIAKADAVNALARKYGHSGRGQFQFHSKVRTNVEQPVAARFEWAFRLALASHYSPYRADDRKKLRQPRTLLVHAVIRDLAGRESLHAWVEKKGRVYDLDMRTRLRTQEADAKAGVVSRFKVFANWETESETKTVRTFEQRAPVHVRKAGDGKTYPQDDWTDTDEEKVARHMASLPWMPVSHFRQMIEVVRLKAYTPAEALENMKKTGSYGPWEGSGLAGGLGAIPESVQVRQALWALGVALHAWRVWLEAHSLGGPSATHLDSLLKLEKKITALIMPGNRTKSPESAAKNLVNDARGVNNLLKASVQRHGEARYKNLNLMTTSDLYWGVDEACTLVREAVEFAA